MIHLSMDQTDHQNSSPMLDHHLVQLNMHHSVQEIHASMVLRYASNHHYQYMLAMMELNLLRYLVHRNLMLDVDMIKPLEMFRVHIEEMKHIHYLVYLLMVPI